MAGENREYVQRRANFSTLEDLRELLELSNSQGLNQRELLKSSVILRRLLLEARLSQTASNFRLPCKLQISIMDIPFVQKFGTYNPDFFIQFDRPQTLGKNAVRSQHITIHFAAYEEAVVNAMNLPFSTQSVKPGKYVKLPAVCWRGQWASRGEIISYAANCLGGVHVGIEKDSTQEMLTDLRAHSEIGEDGAPRILGRPRAFPPETDRSFKDPILIILKSFLETITSSQDIVTLIQRLEHENS